MKETALTTYYRSHLGEKGLPLPTGRAVLNIDMDAITDRANRIRQHPRVTKLLGTREEV